MGVWFQQLGDSEINNFFRLAVQDHELVVHDGIAPVHAHRHTL
jgi:hypothetical protein